MLNYLESIFFKSLAPESLDLTGHCVQHSRHFQKEVNFEEHFKLEFTFNVKLFGSAAVQVCENKWNNQIIIALVCVSDHSYVDSLSPK